MHGRRQEGEQKEGKGKGLNELLGTIRKEQNLCLKKKKKGRKEKNFAEVRPSGRKELLTRGKKAKAH